MKTLTDARILIVDDQPANVRLVERIMRQEGYLHLHSLTDPTAAVAAFEQFAPDLILLDLIMKPISGLDILEQLGTRIAPAAYLPVLVLTADNNAATRHRALAAGAKDFLAKPLDPLEVTLRVRNLLETRRLYLQLQAKTEHLEDEVRERTRRLTDQTRLINLAGDALIGTDLDDRILYWNHGAERLYGWSTDEAVGRCLGELLHRDYTLEREVALALAQCGEWVGEVRKTRKDGSEVVVQCHRTLVRDESGHPFAHFSVYTDLTNLKSLEWQLQRAQRLESVGALASGIAHDLNNMLTPIVMGIGMLKRCVSDDLSQSLLANMSLSADCGRGLVRQLLTFVRGGSETLSELQLPALLKEVVALLRKTFPRTIQIDYEITPPLPPINLDVTRLYQVIMNLCINARDAMPQGGTLTLSATCAHLTGEDLARHPRATPGDFVRLCVADTGVGMSADTLARIFDPFFTTKPEGVGTGLGLSTTASIVADCGGLIRAESEPGHGARFEVFLPASPQPTLRSDSVPTVAGVEGHGECLLVVEDEASLREVIRSTLEASGYRTLAAGDGIEAMALLRRHPEVALLLTDLDMPGMDGLATIAAASAERPGLPCVLVSGAVLPDDAAPLAGHLVKPFTADELLLLLRSIFRGRPHE